MSKLTLSVDQIVVRQAKRYARTRGTSISRPPFAAAARGKKP
jgi:hypothetical protein